MSLTAAEIADVGRAAEAFSAGGALGLQDVGDRAPALAVGLVTADHGAWIGAEIADRLLQFLDTGHGPRQRGVEQFLVERDGEQLIVPFRFVDEVQDAPLRPLAGAFLVEVRVGQKLQDVVVYRPR